MSRKAKVPEEAKRKWARPRLTIACLGYDHWKRPADSLIRNTLVFLEHCHDGRHDHDDHPAARKMRSSARAILLNPDGLDVATDRAPPPPPGSVLYLDARVVERS